MVSSLAANAGTLRLRVEMLGWLQGRAGRQMIGRFRTRKTAALFAYLAYYSDRRHPREQLAQMLWPEARDEASRNSLSQALSSLRQCLARSGADAAALLAADRDSVQLHAFTDVAEFRAAVHASAARDGRIRALTRALELYRGELLPGHYDEWILAERTRLRDLLAAATHELVALLREAGDLPGAAAAAHRGVREDPFSEEAVRDLMQAHLDAGLPRLALRAYHELEASLERELGERPSAPTRELARIVAGSSEPARPPEKGPAVWDTATLMLAQLLAGPTSAVEWARAEIRARGGAVVRGERERLVAAFEHPLGALDCAMRLRAHFCTAGHEMVQVGLALDTFLLASPQGRSAPSAEEVLRLAPALRAGDIVLAEAAAALLRPKLRHGLRLRESGGPAWERLYRLAFPPED